MTIFYLIEYRTYFQKSKLKINKNIKILADNCCQGIEKFHENAYIEKNKEP